MASATSASSKGMVRSARICSFSWPLPAMRTTSPGLAASSARRMAAARSGSMVYATPVAFRPGSISARMASGIFGAGIVAGGDDEIAAFARGLAHLGALGAVAVAAAAEEGDDARAGCCGDLAGERGQVAQRVVGVGVVDDDGEGLAGIDGLEAAGNGLERGTRRRDRENGTPRAWAAVKAASRLRMFTSPARCEVTRAEPAGVSRWIVAPEGVSV